MLLFPVQIHHYKFVQAWDINQEHGKYLTGLNAQRVIVDNLRKKVESMKTLLTPGYSNQGSIFNFPTGNSMNKSSHSIGSSALNDEVFRGK